jgi:hypothetical protein
VQMAVCPADREGEGEGGAGRPWDAGVQMAAFPADRVWGGGASRPGDTGMQVAACPTDYEGLLSGDESGVDDDLSALCDAVEDWDLEACELAEVELERGPPEPPPLRKR